MTRALLLLLPLLALAPGPFRDGPRRVNPLPGLLVYYRLDEASGTRYDSMGANHLTDNNTVEQGQGKMGLAAAMLSSRSERLTVAAETNLNTGNIPEYCVFFWFFMSNTPPSFQALISKRQTAANDELAVDFSSGQLRWYIATNSTFDILTLTNRPSTNAWNFFVGWKDRAATNLAAQLNNGAVESIASSKMPRCCITLELGAQNASSYFTGMIDGFGFMKRIPTAAERAFLWNGGHGALDFYSHDKR